MIEHDPWRFDYLKQVLQPIALQAIKDLEQKLGINFNKNYVDKETRTLFIFGKPVLSATQKICGDMYLDPKVIKPTTFSFMQGVIRLDWEDDFLCELSAALTPEYLESLYSQISDKDAEKIPYQFQTPENRKNCKNFYTHLGYSYIINIIIDKINLIGKFRRIENLNQIINDEFNELIKPFYIYDNNDFDIYTYLQALSIYDVVNHLNEVAPASLGSLYFVFRLWRGCRCRELVGNTIKTFDDYYQGDFICTSQTLTDRIRYIDTPIVRYKLADQSAWQWLVKEATKKDLAAIRRLYCKNDPKNKDFFKSDYAYNNFDLCRESIGAISKLHETISQDMRLALIKFLVKDGIQFSRLGVSLPWHKEFLSLPEFVSGDIFKGLVEFLMSQVGRNELTEKDLINYLKYSSTTSCSLMDYLMNGSVYAAATRNKQYTFSNDKFDERYKLYLEHVKAVKKAVNS